MTNELSDPTAQPTGFAGDHRVAGDQHTTLKLVIWKRHFLCEGIAAGLPYPTLSYPSTPYPILS